MNMLEDLLLQVRRPARYIGEEVNITKKDFDKTNIKFALCFPDLYEVGMSNLGIRIIYGILNNIEDVVCERFFSCDMDMEAILRNNNLEIFSLETKRRLGEFDLVGFSLGYELSYTNMLNILDLGAVPLEALKRDNTYPLIIGGGPCVLNPEPISDFFDLFVFGEAEEVILEIIDIYRKYKYDFKESRISKQDLLMVLSCIDGVYVPSLYKTTYDPGGRVLEFEPAYSDAPCRINKRIIKDLDGAFFPSNWLMPYIEIVHDRITLEVMRGCPNTCRFCQARSQYFPFRQKHPNTILDLASRAYKCSGYEEISLLGLSVSDYSYIEELLASLISLFKERAVSFSLPSIKPKTMVGNLSSLIATIKKTSLTFAPETASDKLRQVLSKNFDIQDFYKSIEQAYESGYQRLKLYFMIGLPYEEEEDLDEIINFAIAASELRRKKNKPPAEVNISINALIPKPHTPFQWFGMEDMDVIRYKQNYLKSKVRNRRLKLNFHNSQMSFLEGVFSRGDRRLSEVLLYAFRKGARFDAWENHFNFEIWKEAFEASNIDPSFYLRERRFDETLPWDLLDIGISKEALIVEANKIKPIAT